MLVAAFQFDVRLHATEANLRAALRGLEAAAERGAQLVVLPEMWPTSFSDRRGSELASVVAESDVSVARVAERAGQLGLAVAGSAYAASGGEKPFNRLLVHARGREVVRYDKVHLFSPTAEDEGFAAGDEPPPIAATELGALSGVVCYDLRFGALFDGGLAGHVDVLAVPAQWPEPRRAHWRALVIGRAVESQCFVVAANRVGTSAAGRRRRELVFAGGSLVVSPHGEVLAEGGAGEELVAAEIEPGDARRMRVRVPVGKDRRPGLYARWRARKSFPARTPGAAREADSAQDADPRRVDKSD